MRSIEIPGGWLLRLERGERLPGALTDFRREKGFPAATAEGLGALADVELGYFDVSTRRYERAVLPGSWELLSLFATIADWDDAPFPHVHVVLSGPDCVARGGHLFSGTVSVTAELRVWAIERPVRRAMDDAVGLHLLDL